MSNRRDVVKQIVHFNTKFRSDYYKTASTDFKYNFPIAMKNVLSMRLRSIDIPNTWYDLSDYYGNTSFFISSHMCWNRGDGTEVVDGTDASGFIKIPEGNYDSGELQQKINDQFVNIESLKNLKIRIDKNDLKTHFLIGGADTEDIASVHYVLCLHFNYTDLKIPLTRTLGWMLGFRHGEYKNIELYGEDAGSDKPIEFVSEGLFDGAGKRYLYISLNDYNLSRSTTNIIFLNNSYIEKDIIGKMYLWDGKFQVNIQDNDEIENLKKRIYHGPVNIKRIHLKILDSYGEIIYLNNMDFSFALEFEILYDNS